jgi:hypothetical protein
MDRRRNPFLAGWFAPPRLIGDRVMNWAKAFEKDTIIDNSNIIDTSDINARLKKSEQPPPLPREDAVKPEQKTPEPEPETAVDPVICASKPKQSSVVDALDMIEAVWLAQLSEIKINADTIETKLRSCVVGLRQDIARLELLGQQAMKEAERGYKGAKHFSSSLDQIKSGR